jgi:hypothetical protein
VHAAPENPHPAQPSPARGRPLSAIHEESGFLVLQHLLRSVYGLETVALSPLRGLEGAARRAREAENRSKLAAFNGQRPDGRGPLSNLRGEEAGLVFVATAEDFSEGVSFMNVRRIILAARGSTDRHPAGDLSPGLVVPSWSLVKQRVGRALRPGGRLNPGARLWEGLLTPPAAARRTHAPDRPVRGRARGPRQPGCRPGPRPARFPPTLDFEKLHLVKNGSPPREREGSWPSVKWWRSRRAWSVSNPAARCRAATAGARCASVDALYYNPDAPPCGWGSLPELYDDEGVPLPPPMKKSSLSGPGRRSLARSIRARSRRRL